MATLRSFRDHVRFIAENAGGRVGFAWVNAYHTARDRNRALDAGCTIAWEGDYIPPGEMFDGDCCSNARLLRHKGSRRPCTNHTVEVCVIRDRDGNVLSSLGGIIDANAAYQWIIEAELLSEAMLQRGPGARRNGALTKNRTPAPPCELGTVLNQCLRRYSYQTRETNRTKGTPDENS